VKGSVLEKMKTMPELMDVKMETIPEITDVALQLLESSGSSTRCYKHHAHNNKKHKDKKGLAAE
jgi:hypothetical protein